MAGAQGSPGSSDTKTEASAPGKIILSGEHAVVHGAPALVTAVRQRARALVRPFERPAFRVAMPDVGAASERTLDDLALLGVSAGKRHEAFMAGRLPAASVLTGASQLVELCLLAAVRAGSPKLARGLHLEVTSGIAVGRGMGSSAAVIASTLQALAAWDGSPLDRSVVERRAQELERFQHGRPSGADVHACVHGGAFLFRRGRPVETLTLAPASTCLVDTGPPLSATGECVEEVRKHFAGSGIWNEFEAVTLALRDAWGRRPDEAAELVRANHELLVRIGVVPQAVAAFIEGLHQRGYAAKICGAGSVRGDRAGMVLVCGGPSPDALCGDAGYPVRALEADEHGLTIHS
jgi:mevalonate kinase